MSTARARARAAHRAATLCDQVPPSARFRQATARPSSRIYYTFTRNAIWVALRSLRPRDAVGAVARDLALMGFAAARAGEMGAWTRGVVDAARGAPQALASRRAMSKATARRLRTVRALKPSLLARAVRHVRERLI